ncbi:ABC transporter [Streptomyces olivoreticuli]
MTALLRYQAALLLRSHRWLPPLLLYGAFMAVGVQSGQPVLDSFGYASAALLPVAAWLVRVCVTNEPAAARDCAAAAAGPWRVHLAAVLTALVASTVLAVAATAVVAAISDPRSADHQVDVPLWPATAEGLVAAVACALLGTGVGALCNRPLLRSTAWAVPSTVLAAFLVLFVGMSPANAAVTGLVSGSRDGTVDVSVLPLAGAAVLTAGAVAVACALSSRRT